MGYNCTFTLHALHPVHLGEVPIKGLPSGYLARVRGGLERDYGFDVRICREDGALFGYEAQKWYEYEQYLRAMSLDCPELIWVLYIEGENSGDIRACYAYRGTAYEEKMPPWVPPPPDMTKLPKGAWLEIPKDPPSVEAVLVEVTTQMKHSSSCASEGGRQLNRCDCHIAVVTRALAALTPGD